MCIGAAVICLFTRSVHVPCLYAVVCVYANFCDMRWLQPASLPQLTLCQSLRSANRVCLFGLLQRKQICDTVIVKMIVLSAHLTPAVDIPFHLP